MIKYIKKLIRNNRAKRIHQIEPYKLFTEKCTKELKIISSFEEDDYCIKIGGYNNQSETVICPLDGTIVVDYYNNIITIDHGYFFINGKIKRVMTEYWNLEEILIETNKDKKVTAGEELGRMGRNFMDGYYLEFRLFIDYESVDPVPFFEASYNE